MLPSAISLEPTESPARSAAVDGVVGELAAGAAADGAVGEVG